MQPREYEELSQYLHAPQRKRISLPGFWWIENCPEGVSAPMTPRRGDLGRGVSIVKSFSRDLHRIADIVLIAYELLVYELQDYPGFEIDERRFFGFIDLLRDVIREGIPLPEDTALYRVIPQPLPHIGTWERGRVYVEWTQLPTVWTPVSEMPLPLVDYPYDPDPDFPLTWWDGVQEELINWFYSILTLGEGLNLNRGQIEILAQTWILEFAALFAEVEAWDMAVLQNLSLRNQSSRRIINIEESNFVSRWVDLVVCRYPISRMGGRRGVRTPRWEY